MSINSTPHITSKELFLTFTKMGLKGFGGVGPFVYTTIVEEKEWMTPKEFTELLAMGQLLPGANVTNFAAMFGYRVNGRSGAFAAVFGILFLPFLVILCLAVVYQHFGNSPVMIGALRGILSVSAGLILVTSLKLAVAQFQNSKKSWPLLMIALTIIFMLIFSLPLFFTVVVLGAVSMINEWRIYQ